MPLAIRLLTRPADVARLVALAGLGAFLSAALALGGHRLAEAATLTALLATAAVLGVLAPLYGRTAAAGLWTARAAIAIGALAALLPVSDAVTGIRVVAALLVVLGLQTVARRARGLCDLRSWTSQLVCVGTLATLLVPGLGGGLLLATAWLAVAAAIQSASAAPARTAPAGA